MATGIRSERDEQAALLEIAMLVARDAPAATVFGAVAEAASRRLGTESAVVLRYVGDERAVVVGTWRDGSRGLPVNAEIDFDTRNSATGRVRRTGEPSRADSYEGHTGELPVLMRALAVRASVAAPLVVDGEVWGALVVTSAQDPFPPGSEHRIADLAELGAVAVARERALRRLEASRRRILEEADAARRRLERELHEGTQQHLLALTLKLRLARSRAEDLEQAELLDDALAEAMTANQALRELARGLYPIALTERGLAAAIQGVAARARVPVHLRELPRRRFPPLAEATAYFLVAGALLTAPEGLDAIAVAVADRGELLLIEVSHARIAAAEPRLQGIVERVVALGGRVRLDGDQVLRAEVPVGTLADGL